VPHPIDPFARQFISDKARQIEGRFRHLSLDREDLKSLMLLDLLKRRPKFDAARSQWTSFVKMIVDHCVADLLEAARRMTPTSQSNWPLERQSAGQDRSRHRSYWAPDPEMASSLKSDVHDTVRELSDEEQQICELISKHPLSEAARRLMISRSTLYRRMDRIRQQFEKRDLDKYL